MKNLVKSASFFTFVFFMIFTHSIFSQNLLVSSTSATSKIEITIEQVNKYLNSFETIKNIQISEMLVSEYNTKHYLLSKDEKGWIFILPLVAKKGKLFIEKSKVLNACQSELLSIEVFKIENGEISGCEKFNHRISSK